MAPQKISNKQLDEFKRVARQLGADESDDALDRAMGKLDLRTKPKPAAPTGGGQSDPNAE